MRCWHEKLFLNANILKIVGCRVLGRQHMLESNFSWTLQTQPPFMPKIKAFIFFVCVREIQERALHGEEVGAWLHSVKKRRALSSLGEQNIETLGFIPRDLGREKKKREECLLSILLSHPHLLQMSFSTSRKVREIWRRIQISQQNSLRAS